VCGFTVAPVKSESARGETAKSYHRTKETGRGKIKKKRYKRCHRQGGCPTKCGMVCHPEPTGLKEEREALGFKYLAKDKYKGEKKKEDWGGVPR